MGTKQFQTEYIGYLENRNTELLNRINRLKENYENKIIAKDLNKQYLISALEDVLNVCSTISEEIDLYFDKMTAAMGEFKNILLKKSEMVQLVDKISKVMNPIKNTDNLVGMDDSSLMKEQYSEGRVGNKTEPVKMSEIYGHIISNEPRVFLRRMQEMFTPDRKGNEGHQLSPIIEASPDTSSDPSNSGSHLFKDIKVPLERINLNKLSFISEESPKSRFKGPKKWKKCLTTNKHQPDHQKNAVSNESSENLNKKYSIGDLDLSHLAKSIDPLEGPSWLFKEMSEMNSSNQFVDYRRRKHRFATVFDKNYITNFEKKSKKSLQANSNEFNENYEEADNEEDFEGSKRKISESSEDFISESFTSEGEDNDDSSKRRKCPSSPRKLAKKTNNENDIEVVKSPNEVSILNSENENRMSTFTTPTCSSSSLKEDSEKNSINRSRKRKSSLTSFKKSYGEQSTFEKTPRRISRIKRGSRISKIRNSKRKKNTSEPAKLKNSGSDEKIKPKKSRTKSPSVKRKSENGELESESKSPTVPEGRKKRKAAPAFKLIEPKLKTKLRRS